VARAEIVHCMQVAEVSPALGFDAMVKALREAKDRAELLQQGVIVHRKEFPAPH
jgi:hypothetical protein